ncbi:HD domain-containing protein [Desulfurivibrio alkaliphilus]|uniref:Metal dependent phosphohydrolase n=1 Tax=Desulfurivibrio alkaliphilus (strain DSM 19089 / UNIQEM U267 / AHT2) TaxID=589865 RepID=D6Z716_DESAT|nr:HD domain-containing protein [Desulfurivibrio alkaliphilus]ADH87003.1 metal dependent phosphohydrolase [Desulfurivibrio alkaliphilus AHT 2]
MQCPGQDSRFWDGSAVFETTCEKCGAELEFFKDDAKRVCKSCGHRMLNPKMDFGCASYCPYAEQCLGELPPELLKKKQEELVDKVAVAVKKLYGDDFKRIGHAGRVANRAAELAADTEGANPAVVRLAAYLHDLYQPAAEAAEQGQATAEIRQLLADAGANTGLVEEICHAVESLHQTTTDNADDKEININLQILHQAHRAAEEQH